MSYNNYVDGDAAWRAAHDHGDAPTVAIIKHANPCGIAVGADVAEAHRQAHACDPVSAFGGVIATNVPVSLAMAEQVAEVFTEVVVAPGFEDGAVELLREEAVDPAARRAGVATPSPVEMRPVSGGLLHAGRRPAAGARRRPGGLDAGHRRARRRRRCSPTCSSPGGPAAPSRATRSCSPAAARPSASAWARSTGSTRARLAVAGPATGPRGSVAASDAFFPFADGLQVLLDAGVRAVVQPGGSVRDEEVVAAAAAAGATLYLTGTRHFFH